MVGVDADAYQKKLPVCPWRECGALLGWVVPEVRESHHKVPPLIPIQVRCRQREWSQLKRYEGPAMKVPLPVC